MLPSTFVISCLLSSVSAALTDSSLSKHANSLKLSASFSPIKESYWTGYPHHRRTPFAVSPEGKSAYLAYLDASETDVHVQQVDPSTFASVGTASTVSGAKEAAGLVAHNDGFALLTNEALPSGTSNAPAGNTPVPVLYRYTSGKQSWKTFLGGPGVHESEGLHASPDVNGDLAYSEAAGIYGAYFVVTAYSGFASGHFGDAIQYVGKDGKIQQIAGASSTWGCSHNTGIAFEAADAAPFASICSEDQGAIWLNTKTQSMNGVKISNENVTNGGSGEPMGGMSGSYSGLARFQDSASYIFTWVSRGAKDLTTNDWLGSGFTHSVNRTNNRRVAIAQMSDKSTLVGQQATSQLVADGDSQVNWITEGSADCSNAHVATFDGSNALVTWEEIAEPQCDFIAMGCKGKFTGSYFQLVNGGKKVGAPIKAMDVFVAGDMVTMGDGRICWPYVDMEWSLDGPIRGAASVTDMSFACMSIDGSGSTTPPASSRAASAASTPAASTPAASAPATPSAAKPTSAVEAGVSSGLPIEIESSSSAAAVTPTPAPAPPAQSAPAQDSELPTFEIVTSGATVTPPATDAPVVPSPTSTSAYGTPTEFPMNPPLGTSTALPIPSEVPEVPEASSSVAPTAPEVPASSAPCAPTVTVSTTATVTVTVGASSTAPISGIPIPFGSSSTLLPIASSTALPANEPPYPFPSGSGRPSGHYGWGPRPTGSWPTGWPRPSGGFGHVRPRPTRGFGGPRPNAETPCDFGSQVKPTATPAAY